MNNYGGNVLIGTTEDNGAKLQVNGNISIGYNHLRFVDGTTNYFIGWGKDNMLECNSLTGLYFTTGGEMRMIINPSGDVHVKGNLVVDGEVSAGGASEEGGSSSGGGGNMVAQTLTKGRDTYSVSHNLDTKDVIVCIYEKDGNSDRWDMILTDIEITDKDNITVTFGSVTTVDHRVVIMGAVA